MKQQIIERKWNKRPDMALRLALALAAVIAGAVELPAGTIIVPGPSTNASPLRFKAIGAGEWHSLGVLSNGTVVAWGDNNSGKCNVPAGLSGVIAVTGGDNHSLALKSDGTVVAWGDNIYLESTVPGGLNHVVDIAAGELHSLAVKSDGTVAAWGIGQPGAAVDGNDYGQSVIPDNLGGGFVAVAAGYAHNLALRSDGTVVAWGRGQTVNPSDGVDFGQAIVPGGLNHVVAIAAGRYHSLALKADGTVVAWGDNGFGQTDVPAGLNGVVAISARIHNSMALKSNGTVVTWGELSTQNPVPGLGKVVAIAAGGLHDLALESNGSLVTWGDDSFGQTFVPGSVITDTNLQNAVNVANNGDTVLVEPGQYNLSNQVTVSKAITLRSAMGAGQTILNALNNNMCLWISNSLAVADGFTFSAGGILSVGATIQDCIFTNTPIFGPGPGTVTMIGGILSNSVVAYQPSPVGFFTSEVFCTGNGLVTDCQILGSGHGGNGGAVVYLENSRLNDSLVAGDPMPGGESATGPAVAALSSTITGCTISGNYSTDSGAGASLNNCLMDRCIVAYNTCINRSQSFGGGIFETNSIIRDSLIVGNSAAHGAPDEPGGFGGGVYMQGGDLINCTVSQNSALNGFPTGPSAQLAKGAGVYVESGGVTNCIIFGNSIAFALGNTSNVEWFNAGPGSFDHCCTTPNPGGVGNIVQDPQFVSPTNDDFHLVSTSPCIGAGVVQSWMTGAFDLDGNPRTANGVVDMGAYQELPPAQQIAALIGMVNSLVQQGTLNHGRGNTLLVNLNAALGYLNSGKTSAACDQVAKFIGRVQALVDHGNLTPLQGQPLTDIANQLALALGC